MGQHLAATTAELSMTRHHLDQARIALDSLQQDLHELRLLNELLTREKNLALGELKEVQASLSWSLAHRFRSVQRRLVRARN
jgi:hypothetical protein